MQILTLIKKIDLSALPHHYWGNFCLFLIINKKMTVFQFVPDKF